MLLIVLAPTAAILSGCPNIAGMARVAAQSDESVQKEQRIATCQEAMRLRAKEANVGGRDQETLIAQCEDAQKERSLAQWECVVAKQNNGLAYADAAGSCAKPAPASAK